MATELDNSYSTAREEEEQGGHGDALATASTTPSARKLLLSDSSTAATDPTALTDLSGSEIDINKNKTFSFDPFSDGYDPTIVHDILRDQIYLSKEDPEDQIDGMDARLEQLQLEAEAIIMNLKEKDKRQMKNHKETMGGLGLLGEMNAQKFDALKGEVTEIKEILAKLQSNGGTDSKALEEKRKCNALASKIYQLEKQLSTTQAALDKERDLNQRKTMGAKALPLSDGHPNRPPNAPAGKREKGAEKDFYDRHGEKTLKRASKLKSKRSSSLLTK